MYEKHVSASTKNVTNNKTSDKSRGVNLVN